ncbi:MAG: hypothetical protein WCA49_25365 [Candidatus Sulfotelmatobacter sp.]
MSVSSIERILDVAVDDFYTADCSVLQYGPPHEKITIAADSPSRGEYKEGRKILRWYIGLMGDTSPEISPLSVDVAGDKNYRVYRYDWVFGVSLPNLPGPEPGKLWWNWQKALTKGTAVAVQLLILPGDSGIAYTCVATNLNVLPPSRDTQTWLHKHRSGVIDFVKAGAKTAEEIYPGMITKAFSALSNSLDARGKWRRTNWFIYQFLDSDSQACAVEWLINKKVLKQYGALLRGSLVMAFHGAAKAGTTKQKCIRIVLRPQLGFNPEDELSRVSPTQELKDAEKVQLEILPGVSGEAGK